MRLNHSAHLLAVAIAAIVLAACAYAPGVDADLSPQKLLRSKTAVGIIQMGIEGEGCVVTTIKIARRNGPKFEVLETLTFLPVPRSAGDAAQFELPPGEYHIVSWHCNQSVGHHRQTVTLGKYVGGNMITGGGGEYTQTFAQFTLAAGEIVNLGYVRMIRVPPSGIRMDVVELQPGQLEKIAKDKPQLVAETTKRFAKLTTHQLATTTHRR